MPEAEERARDRRSDPPAHRGDGPPPTGWYTGRCSMNTVRLTAERAVYLDLDTYDDDLPYWTRLGARDQLVIPYTLEANDMRFATAPGYIEGEQFYGYLKDASTRSMPKAGGRAEMMSIGLHCRLIGRPGKIAGLKRFIDHAEATGGCGSPAGSTSPSIGPPSIRRSASSRPRRCARRVYRSIRRRLRAFPLDRRRAPRAWNLARRMTVRKGCGTPWPGCSAPPRSRRAQSRAARPSRPCRQTGAGEAADRRSSAEQAAAGLDALTDAERAKFPALNAATSPNSASPSSSRCATTPAPPSSPLSSRRLDRPRRPNSPRPAARWNASPGTGVQALLP